MIKLLQGQNSRYLLTPAQCPQLYSESNSIMVMKHWDFFCTNFVCAWNSACLNFLETNQNISQLNKFSKLSFSSFWISNPFFYALEQVHLKNPMIRMILPMILQGSQWPSSLTFLLKDLDDNLWQKNYIVKHSRLKMEKIKAI